MLMSRLLQFFSLSTKEIDFETSSSSRRPINLFLKQLFIDAAVARRHRVEPQTIAGSELELERAYSF